jgi:hypothetical protein
VFQASQRKKAMQGVRPRTALISLAVVIDGDQLSMSPVIYLYVRHETHAGYFSKH